MPKVNLIPEHRSPEHNVRPYLPQFFQVYHLIQQSKIVENCTVLEAPSVATHMSWHILASIAMQS